MTVIGRPPFVQQLPERTVEGVLGPDYVLIRDSYCKGGLTQGPGSLLRPWMIWKPLPGDPADDT